MSKKRGLPDQPSPVGSVSENSLAANAKKLLKFRKHLPVWQCQDEIVSLFDQHSTLVLVGETGSGKTTQIPQFLNRYLVRQRGMVRSDSDGLRRPKATMIGITQPRRVAAVTVAQRVADEQGCRLGDRVGYAIRFDDCTKRNRTQIKFMTDGILLREAMLDPLLSRYAAIVLDEAHERTVHTDVLFGVLKDVQQQRLSLQQDNTGFKTGTQHSNGSIDRAAAASAGGGSTCSDCQKKSNRGLPPLKLLVMSATLNAQKFSKFLGDAPILYVEGRQHPVDIYYSLEPQSDYVDAAANTVLQLHDEGLPGDDPVNRHLGDILVFLPGQEQIEACHGLIVDRLERMYPPIPVDAGDNNGQPVQTAAAAEQATDQTSTAKQQQRRHPKAASLQVCVLYAALPTELQLRVFEKPPPGVRRAIIATNIAETSVTINGVRAVVDCGLQKTRAFNSRLGLDTLAVVPVSKANAQQRAGRAGREAPGVCYRLYTEVSHARLPAEPVPEILRCDLATVVLQLKALGVAHVAEFPFIDPPPRNALRRALALLATLGALKRADGVKPVSAIGESARTPSNVKTPSVRTSPQLTELGRQMAAFPLDPRFSRTLIAASETGCAEEVLTIVAMLGLDEALFVAPRDRREQADRAKRRFAGVGGDHFMCLNVFREFEAQLRQPQGQKVARRWCTDHCLSTRALRRAQALRAQLVEYVDAAGLARRSCGGDLDTVARAFVTGFFANAAVWSKERRSYRALVDRAEVHFHPASVLRGSRPPCVLYTELVLTQKAYMRDCIVIDQSWLAELAPQLYKHSI